VSRAELRAVVDQHVFDPKPSADWFYATHVPFDELFASSEVEDRVTSCARAGSRAAIVGPSGCGKTSMVTYALAQHGDPDLRPIWVRVAAEQPQVVREVAAFGRLVIDSIVWDARIALSEHDRAHALASASERYEAEAPHITRRFGWSGAHLDAAREITSIAESISRETTTTRITSALDELLATIGKRGSQPVLVIDDSDKVLRMVGDSGGEKALVSAFLSRILPWLSELDCAKVVAFHPAYEDNPHWSEAIYEGLTGRRVDVPRLRDAGQLSRILDARLHPFGVQAALTDVVEDDAVAVIFEHYRGTPEMTIRRALTLTKSAAEDAWDSGADRVGVGHVRSALADLG
jgi:Cdc6-like AAA superfamily ATPase